eukprot:TRINITY_DN1634_c0_g2_i2.p1 TRINITY_DN1634_c0_g2~~TRINITY_DN1634_c0_g2_i2.p1  ORF type:complete len:128 (+),score=23.58 TRINITY_DN1634_c0_g2_i2:351-734(+)
MQKGANGYVWLPHHTTTQFFLSDVVSLFQATERILGCRKRHEYGFYRTAVLPHAGRPQVLQQGLLQVHKAAFMQPPFLAKYFASENVTYEDGEAEDVEGEEIYEPEMEEEEEEEEVETTDNGASRGE